MAAVGCRLVGLLPAGRRPVGDLAAGGLDSAPHPAVLLAALAQRAGSWPRLAALGGSRAEAALCADAARRVVGRGAADDADGLVERNSVLLRVRDAIGSRGPMTAAGSHRRIRLTPTSGGVGGCRGAIPGTRPDQGTLRSFIRALTSRRKHQILSHPSRLPRSSTGPNPCGCKASRRRSPAWRSCPPPTRSSG